MQVNHRCGNRRCCNPEHLYAGTQLENFHDMVGHKTHVPPPRKIGEAVGTSKLTNAEARAIKDSLAIGCGVSELARQYGVSPSTVSLIKRGLRWQEA